MDKYSGNCARCNKPYEVSNKNRSAPIAFCRPCRKIHSKDIIEIITSKLVIYSEKDLLQAEQALLDLPGTDIRLDYHGVLDTISEDIKLGDGSNNICCISYVGQLTTTRINAREDMMNRMKSNQISYGILVFKRGSRRFPEAGDKFVDPGSKAWANKLISSNSANPIFIDDSTDHVRSVQFAGIDSYLFSPSDGNLVKFLDNIMQKRNKSSDSSDELAELELLGNIHK